MTIGFTLNGDEVIVKADANQRLIDILRSDFSLIGAKTACRSGHCGVCTVLFNNIVTPSCLIPAFQIKGAKIITIEGFADTREYRDIIKGFQKAGVENCGFCDAGKIFITESILRRKRKPQAHDAAEAFDSIKCRCTDNEALVAGVLAAAEIRAKRLLNEARLS